MGLGMPFNRQPRRAEKWGEAPLVGKGKNKEISRFRLGGNNTPKIDNYNVGKHFSFHAKSDII